MQVEEIEAFLTIVQMGSITDASGYLHITQPTLSHRIQVLESELGGELLFRGKGQRTIKLTELGARFLPIAEKWVRLKGETAHFISDIKLTPFRVGAGSMLSTYIMPKVYARFAARNLPVDMYLYCTHFAESYDLVASGVMDAIFVSRTMSSNRVSAIPVLTEKMVLLCNKNLGISGPVHPRQLPIEKCVFGMWSLEYKLWFDYWFGSSDYHITVDNFRLAENIISTSDMWAIVPLSIAKFSLPGTNLAYYDVLESPPGRTIYMLTLEPRHQYINELIDDLIASIE